MAKYDHGGGCSCGLQKECNCGSDTVTRYTTKDLNIESESKDRIMADNDFGFLLVSEEELKRNEELLKKKVEEQSVIVVKTASELNEKIKVLRSMIMPLLNNLAKDPDKEYIRWPDRAEKISAFIKRLNDFVDT